ncbi:MAG TPA: hypothetical protein VGX68_21290 [Thermoanaerobaculia bacterium]|jgi:hypothetical protein|nr:hypothetical protein [Thermoanaerobaculia bacterium]
MKPRNTRVLVFATALLTAPLLPAWSQAPVHPRPPQQQEPKPPKVVIKETPVEQGAPQDQGAAQGQTQDPATAQGQAQGTPQEQGTTPPAEPQQGTQATPPGQTAAPGQPGQKVVKPEEIGISFAPPQGWQQGDPTKVAVTGDPCCVWSPDNVASIVAFVQRPGKPLNPKVLLEQSAKALQSAFGAEVKTKEVKDIGGLRGFSLVVTAPGNGGAVDGKGTVPTTQHWIGIPRAQDVIVFLMTTPDASFAQNEQVFQGMLNTLKVSGTQTPDQQASK